MDGEVIGDPPRLQQERAELTVRCGAVGQVDSLGRFTFTVAPSLADPSGVLRKEPTPRPEISGPDAPILRIYLLIKTDTHWEISPGLKTARKVNGPVEWRIEDFESSPWVTVEAAIRYLDRLRATSSNEPIRKNADRSIEALQRHSRKQ